MSQLFLSLSLAVVLFIFTGTLALGASADASIGVSLTTATAYRDRNPENPTQSFVRDQDPIFAALVVRNQTGTETTVYVNIEREGVEPAGPHPGVALTVPARSRPYRTVARFTSSRLPGSYKVVVRNAEGVVLAETNVSVSETAN